MKAVRSSTEDVSARLAAVEVLGELPQRVRSALAHRCRTGSVTKGSVVFVPGDPPALFVVERGRIVILNRPSEDTEIELFDRHPGELFGELSLLLDEQVDEARAAESTLLFRIDGHALQSALRESQPATLALATLLARRMSLAEARIGGVTFHKVKERLLLLLDQLAADGGIADSRGYLLRDRLTHEELARMVGASRVSVSRALSQLRRAGQVVLSGQRIVVQHRLPS